MALWTFNASVVPEVCVCGASWSACWGHRRLVSIGGKRGALWAYEAPAVPGVCGASWSACWGHKRLVSIGGKRGALWACEAPAVPGVCVCCQLECLQA